MSPLGTIARFGGIALIVFALAAPLAYCTVRIEEGRFALQRGCLEAKGEWIKDINGPRCSLAKTESAK